MRSLRQKLVHASSGDASGGDLDDSNGILRSEPSIHNRTRRTRRPLQALGTDRTASCCLRCTEAVKGRCGAYDAIQTIRADKGLYMFLHTRPYRTALVHPLPPTPSRRRRLPGRRHGRDRGGGVGRWAWGVALLLVGRVCVALLVLPLVVGVAVGLIPSFVARFCWCLAVLVWIIG